MPWRASLVGEMTLARATPTSHGRFEGCLSAGLRAAPVTRDRDAVHDGMATASLTNLEQNSVAHGRTGCPVKVGTNRFGRSRHFTVSQDHDVQ